MAIRDPSLVPLSHDHRDALMLAFRLQHPSPPGPVTALTPASTPASRAAETIAFHDAELRPHFLDEEELLFPLVATACAGDAVVQELIATLRADHVRLGVLRDTIEAANSADVEPLLDEFAALLEPHVRREERELFAILPSRMAPADLAAFGEALQARRAQRGRACAR